MYRSNSPDAISQQSSHRTEEIDERYRDPPPPANFPVVCPKNTKLKFILDRIDKNVFQRNGLHKIPYRTQLDPNQPVPVYNGESWPDVDEVVEEISTINVSGNDVIDVRTQQSEEAEIAEKNKVLYHDIPHKSLTKFIAAIHHPLEMRLLPHIIREWHRQSFPITLANAQKIARLATEHNEVDVILQMTRPDVYGLYYNMHGIREITRAMAKRVSNPKKENGETDDLVEKDRKPFKPEDMLHHIPELLNCAVGDDAKLLLNDPAVLGTQLWAFVERFNHDETYRTTKSIVEICGLAAKVSTSLVNNNFGPTIESIETTEGTEQSTYTIKFETSDHIPVIYALLQFTEIIFAPYHACLAACNRADPSKLDQHIQDVKTDVAKFIGSYFSSPSTLYQSTDPESTEYQARKAQEARWIKLNWRVATELKKGRLHLLNLQDWEWDLLKLFTGPAAEGPNASIDEAITEMYFAPIRGLAAMKELEQRVGQWRRYLMKKRVRSGSNLRLKVIEYGHEIR